MGSLSKAIGVVACLLAGSVAQALPVSYDEAVSGDLIANLDSIRLFEFGIGNNVIAGTEGIGGDVDDFDIFSFVVPERSVLSFVTVEFDAFDFTGPLTGFGPSYLILRGAFTGGGQFIDSSQTATDLFTNVLTSSGPQSLFTRLPIGPGTYDWLEVLGRDSTDESVDFEDTSATWSYRLTFGVDSVDVPEPAPLALMSLGLLALWQVRGRRRRNMAAAV